MRYLALAAFLLTLPVLAYGVTVIGVSPYEQQVCVAPGSGSSAHFYLSTNSNYTVPAIVSIGGLEWVTVEPYVEINKTFDLQFFTDPPKGTKEGQYVLDITICTETGTEGGISTRGCLKPVLNINVTQACGPPEPPPAADIRDTLRSAILAVLVITLAVFSVRFIRYGKRI